MTLISEGYRKLQEKMHEMPRGYGGTNAEVYGATIMATVDAEAPVSVLDYGAGKGHIGEYLFAHGYKGFYHPYDPAIPYWADVPEPADLVVCIDVLEHIEPEYLDNVLSDLRRVLRKSGIITIHHRKANKTLPDGRNAHLTIEPPEWWWKKLEGYFSINKAEASVGKHDGKLLTTIYHVSPLSW